MSELADRHCKACEGGVEAYTIEVAERQLRSLSTHWQLTQDAKALTRQFQLHDFYRTMSLVNAIAHVANIEDHHPDLEVGYNYCRVRYSTHAIGGLSENDFICAGKIDRIPL
jgi:4a-hydroxytetrahydrobiopterin dehydratase